MIVAIAIVAVAAVVVSDGVNDFAEASQAMKLCEYPVVHVHRNFWGPKQYMRVYNAVQMLQQQRLSYPLWQQLCQGALLSSGKTSKKLSRNSGRAQFGAKPQPASVTIWHCIGAKRRQRLRPPSHLPLPVSPRLPVQYGCSIEHICVAACYL